MKECDWCGKNYRKSGYNVGGHEVCSEKCRLEISESINNGDTAEKSNSGCVQAIVWIAVALFVFFFVLN
ncbi:MAG: hypothetical protein WA958_07680 [Tunicatimonas sp.]